MDHETSSNLDSAMMDTDRAIDGKKIEGFISPRIESVTPTNPANDPRKLSYATDKGGLMNLAAIQHQAQTNTKLRATDIDCTKSEFSYNDSVFIAAQARYQQTI